MPLPSIDSRTQLAGLIGWPVEHSLSPLMHNAAFDALGMNWRYLPLPVPPDKIHAAVQGLGALGFRGANVTVPHKQAVLRALGRLLGPRAIAPDAAALGAVNTLVVEQDKTDEPVVTGHNTDAAGFVRALRTAGIRLDGISAVVVGAGGGARAVVYGLIQAGAAPVTVLNRSVEHAEALVADLAAATAKSETAPGRAVNGPHASTLRAAPLSTSALLEESRTATLMVHATPVGMWPRDDASIWPDDAPLPAHLTVLDLVYNPSPTKLLRQAEASGARAIDGLEMLVQQGVLAFAMWTGREAPVEVMRRTCRRALGSSPRP